MTFGVKPTSTSPSPGFYKNNVRVEWDYYGNLFKVGLTFSPTPALVRMSAIIDSESTRRGLINVYQDKFKGNVLFDADFNKLKNQQVAIIDPQTFAELPGPLKYLYNGFVFCANYEKTATGNRKFLILGDVTNGDYWIKDTVNLNAFGKTLNTLANVGNWQFSYKDCNDYSGGLIDVTTNELDNYVGVMLVSSRNDGQAYLTTNAINNLMAFREKGNGIFIITGSGVAVNNITAAQQPQLNSYFNTANQLATKYTTWFTSTIDRTKNVTALDAKNTGYLPLCYNLSDTDIINPIGSGSYIQCQEFTPLVSPGSILGTNLTTGFNQLNWIALNDLGQVFSASYVYAINPDSDGLISFKNLQGNLINELNVGKSNTGVFDVVLDGSFYPTMSGNLYKNNIQIGTVKYDSSNGGNQTTFFGGYLEPILVNNGDVFKATINNPFNYELSLPVVRIQPDLNSTYSLSESIKRLTAFGGVNVPPRNQLLTSYDIVGKTVPYLPFYSQKSTSMLLSSLRKYFNNDYYLPERPVIIFDTTSEFNAYIGNNIPPTKTMQFNLMSRFNGDSFYVYPNFPAPAGNPAATWQYDTVNNQYVQPNNTSTYNGILFKYPNYNYDIDVVVSSDDSTNDDAICIVIAHRYVSNVNRTLSVVINRGLSGTSEPSDANIMLVLDYKTPRQTIIAKNLLNNEFTPWNGAYKRVHISRRDTVFTFYFSKWNSTILENSLTMTLDLRTNTTLFQDLIGVRTSYGFGCYGQANSKFSKVTLSGSLLTDIACNYETNEIYRWNGSFWVRLDGVNIGDILGEPRYLTDQDQLFGYRIEKDGTIIKN